MYMYYIGILEKYCCSEYDYCTTYILLYVLGIFYVCFLLWNISPLAVSAQFLDEQVELLSDI